MNHGRYSFKTTLASFFMFFVVGLVLFTSSSGKTVAEKPEAVDDNKEIQFIRPTVDYTSRGRSYLKKGQIDDAISDLDKAIASAPENAVAYFSRGNAYYMKGQVNEAISDYNKAIELDPDYAEAYINRGYIHHVIREEYPEAVSDYSRAVELNPKDAETYHFRGSAYLSQSRYDEALSDFNRAIALNPRYPNAYVSRGNYYHYNKKQYVRAIEDYSAAVKLNPEDAVARRLRRDAYVRIQSIASDEDISSMPVVKVVPTFFKDNNQITNAYC